MDENSLLDYAIFQISPSQNRYDSIIFCKGKTEKYVSGPLAPLSLFLPDAKEIKSNSSNGSFKLELNENIRASSWFNKSTLARFLNIVNSNEMVKSAEAILNEMSQLEETRKFHLSLYSKVNAGTVNSEGTKNELLKALELRLTALNEETAQAFTQSLSSNSSSIEISNLTSFIQQFCPPDLKNTLSSHLNSIQTIKVSPAKLAQIERQDSSESEQELNDNHSINSSNEDLREERLAERSRPLMRAPSPRRSASPMRRVQIGRSGSRRAQAIAIKSLIYFPGRDRAGFDRDLDDASNGEEEVKKTEVNVTRLSVKDAISMFECKQQDIGGDKKGNSGFGGPNKAVLRRWSSGMGDSRTSQNETQTQNENENENENSSDFDSNRNVSSEGEKKGEEEEVKKGESEKQSENFAHQEIEMETSVNVSIGEEKPELKEIDDKAATSAEWNRQKEAELEMLLKMMGAKPGNYGLTGLKSTEQKGSLNNTQKRDSRDSKLRAEKPIKTVKKQGQDNVITANKSTSVSKKATSVTKEKKISPIPPQRVQRRNSSPQIAPKKEVVSKSPAPPVSSKKASPRSSPVPPSSSLTRSINSQKSKSTTNLNTSSNSNTPISRRKPQITPQITPPSTQPSPKRTERVIKAKKELGGEIKPIPKGQTENKPKTVVRTSNKGTKSKNSPLGGEEAKPSFYNKVTKKSSVVPLESKPNLKKSTIPAKNKLNSNIQASPKSSTKSLVQSQDKEEPVPTVQEPTIFVPEVNEPQAENNKIDVNIDILPTHELNNDKPENQELKSNENEPVLQMTITTSNAKTELQPEEEMCISSDAWVEEEQQLEAPVLCETGEQASEHEMDEIEPASSSSPKIRHSLSQMLQAEIQEPEIIEWGNAENPPALVFQKDSPKGFKRLLKFARKSNNNNYNNNNTNSNGCPSVNSEGEEEVEEVKGVNTRNFGGLNVKGNVQQQRALLSESFDGGVTSKRVVGGQRINSGSAAHSSGSNLNLRDGHVSSAKASRSFFSLSNFRSSKSNETKPR